MDVEMTDVSSGRSSETITADKDLVKTVRSLDQTGPGANGENLEKVWKLLTSVGQSQFSAAEESVLRWLLKTMKANNDEAEMVRRFPLTWRILGCSFQRIPLFSLAKSLADRKFMAVLQQTLKSIAKPEPPVETSDTPKKRKRRSSAKFELQSVKSFDGCLATGEAIFGALKILLARLDPSAQWSAHDRMGAEHIKALFALPANDVAEYLAPLLTLCDSSLAVSDTDLYDSQESWIKIFASVWDLHLQGAADALEVATFFSRPAFTILGKLKGDVAFSDEVKRLWTRELEKFLQRNLVLPARAAYFNKTDLEVVTRAFAVLKNITGVAVPLLYNLVSSAPQVVGGLTTTKANEAWMQEVFKLSERALRHLSAEEKSTAIGAVLVEAIANKSHIAVDDLRSLCSTYALVGSNVETDWRILSLIAKCDADVFLQSDEGLELFNQACDRITEADAKANEEIMTELIESLIIGFENARDLSTFLQKWFDQMSKFEDKGLRSGGRPVWFTSIHRNSTLIGGIEKSLTTKQLVNLLQWVENHDTLRPSAVLVFVNTIATAITTDESFDAIGIKMSDLAQKVWSSSKVPSDIRSLRWRIVAKTVSRSDYEQSEELWNKLKKDLSKTLKKAKLDNEDTSEALACAYQFWLSMYPDGDAQVELASLLSDFVKGLLEKVETKDIDGLLETGTSSSSDPSNVPKFCTEYPLAVSRLLALLFNSSGTLPDYLKRMLGDENNKRLGVVLGDVVSSDENLRDQQLMAGVVDHIIQIFEEVSQKSSGEILGCDERSKTALKELLAIPVESITRQQRERILETIIPKIEAASLDTTPWALILGLVAHIMRMPTFYENMAFSDLRKIAERLATVCKKGESKTALALNEVLYKISFLSIRQMNGDQEHRAEYFKAVGPFLEETASGSDIQATLLKALLSVELSDDEAKEKSAAFDVDRAASELGSKVEGILSDWASSWKKKKLPKAGVNPALIVLDAAEALPDSVVSKMKLKVSRLEEASKQAISHGCFSGWKLRSFLLRRFPSQLVDPRPTSFGELFKSTPATLPDGQAAPDPVSDFNRRDILEECVDAVVSGLDYDGKVAYVQSLLEGVHQDATETDVPVEGQLLAIRHVIPQLTGKCSLISQKRGFSLTHDTEAPTGLEKAQSFDLATAHGILTRHLAKASTVQEFKLTAEVLHQLLNVKANSMTQWNIESTLSTVAVIVANDPHHLLEASPSVYHWLCRLMEVIIKKHRLRIEGHYHILVSALEALLGALARPFSPQHAASVRAGHAARFARLVTLVCEPAAAAVSRVQHLSALDSATDAAKRSAGRHMYLVLMAYVKMQLDVDVPRDVREALTPAVNSAFDISPPEIRKILNDSMDASGRAILREMYRRYTKFGKWTGV
ncbi:urb2 npa2 family protein [Colletotrichum musicola]|uniref:Urb2 npa2 family protein n=1 Tax=Colletotrichum musicola TaxID=2175873 RepID=A0A8H6NZE8_9PEZI|nr:urb2 npa2 family protein [Colletotrichum musicola]